MGDSACVAGDEPRRLPPHTSCNMPQLPISSSDPKKGGYHFSVCTVSLFPGSESVAMTTRGGNASEAMQSAWARIELALLDAGAPDSELSLSIGQQLTGSDPTIGVAITLHDGHEARTIFSGDAGGAEAWIASGQLRDTIAAQVSE